MIQIFAEENLMIKKLFVLLFKCTILVASQRYPQQTPPPNDYIRLMGGNALKEFEKLQKQAAVKALLKEKSQQPQPPVKVSVVPTRQNSQIKHTRAMHTAKPVISCADCKHLPRKQQSHTIRQKGGFENLAGLHKHKEQANAHRKSQKPKKGYGTLTFISSGKKR